MVLLRCQTQNNYLRENFKNPNQDIIVDGDRKNIKENIRSYRVEK